MYENLKKIYPHIAEWLAHGGGVGLNEAMWAEEVHKLEDTDPQKLTDRAFFESLRTSSLEKCERHPFYKSEFRGTKNKHVPILRVEDKGGGFVWEDAIKYETLGDALADLDNFLPKWTENEAKRIKPSISMLAFLKTGRFGTIELNMSHDEVEELLGRPESYAFPFFFGYQEASFWTYGRQMEFHFYEHNKLSIIHDDWLAELRAIDSRAFDLTDSFFLDDEGALLNNKQIEEKLLANAIRFEYYERSTDGSLMILCESGVKIDLQMDKIINGSYGIHCVAKSIYSPESRGYQKITID